MKYSTAVVLALVARAGTCFAQCSCPAACTLDVNWDINLRLPFLAPQQCQVTQGYCGFSHTGNIGGYPVDFDMPEGTPVVAAASGWVAVIEPNGVPCGGGQTPPPGCTNLNGKFVRLRHQGGQFTWYSTYCHLSQVEPTLVMNQYIAQGAEIGRSGNTGWSSDPHLHFQIQQGSIGGPGARPVPMVGVEVGTPGAVIYNFFQGREYRALNPGGWTVVNLAPASATGLSGAYGVGGGQQVGEARVGGPNHASLWTASAGSWVDLHPAWAGATSSTATGVSGGRQVGTAFVNQQSHAGLWSGAAATWIDLHPAGAAASQGYGVSGSLQVGTATFAGIGQHAARWNGNAGSWADLNPAGATISEAFGVDGVQVVGYADSHACLWPTATSSQRVDVNPSGATSSRAYGVYGGRQVGWASFNFGADHAILWSGTAASWVDLNPAGATSSQAYGVYGSQQVGQAALGGVWQRAGLWRGTAASWVDLHASLPAGFFASSLAHGIWSDGVSTYVVGWGENNATGRTEALMWVGPVPGGGKGCYANCDGSTTAPILNILDFGCFLNKFAAGDSYANCDGSTTSPVLNVLDFGCFLNAFAAGCT